jgi:hypothetical protein
MSRLNNYYYRQYDGKNGPKFEYVLVTKIVSMDSTLLLVKSKHYTHH